MRTQYFSFWSSTLAHKQWPPTEKWIVFISVFQGFVTHHCFNNSLSVQARQTFLSGALNVLEIRIDFSFKSFTTRFLGVLAILFWFKNNTSNGLIQNLLLFIRIEQWTIKVNLFLPKQTFDSCTKWIKYWKPSFCCKVLYLSRKNEVEWF